MTAAEAFAAGLTDADALALVLAIAADQARSWGAEHSGEAPESPGRTLLEGAYLDGLLSALSRQAETDATGDHR